MPAAVSSGNVNIAVGSVCFCLLGAALLLLFSPCVLLATALHEVNIKAVG